MNSEKEIEKHFNEKIESLKNERDRCLRSFRMTLLQLNSLNTESDLLPGDESNV
jgi:demethoxyubiquinone hydroxylase (CLK1/Coq7/Cat5 family)